MKKLFLIFFLASIISSYAVSWDISLKWTKNPTNQNITKYIVYQATGTSTNFVPVGTVTTNFAKIKVFSPGIYRYKVSAVNELTNSPLSNGVKVTAR